MFKNLSEGIARPGRYNMLYQPGLFDAARRQAGIIVSLNWLQPVW
jgi:hypothetical protein